MYIEKRRKISVFLLRLLFMAPLLLIFFHAVPQLTEPAAAEIEIDHKVRVVDRDKLMAAMRIQRRVKVIVTLRDPETKKLMRASARHGAILPGRKVSEEAARADTTLAAHVASLVGGSLSKLEGTGYRVRRLYRFFPLMALDISEDALSRLESFPEVVSVSLDKSLPLPEFKSSLKFSTWLDLSAMPARASLITPAKRDAIGAGNAWEAGYTGNGWYVAILDTGVLTDHEAFAGKDIVEACFAGNSDCPNGETTMYGQGSAAPFTNSFSGYEHGTHVAGIAVGNSESLSGVAKDANLIAVQVYTGYYNADECPNSPAPCARSLTSDQIAALDYIYSLRGTYPIASVNMSLGGDAYSDQLSCDADNAGEKIPVDMLRDAGIATVMSSGNEYYCNAVGEPGCLSSAISVGAVDSNDNQVSYSNWHYSMLRLLAPGDTIYSAVPDSSTSYGYLSGTSMAAPHVAGAWAILKQQNPAAGVSDIYYSLASTGASVKSDCPHINDYKPRIQIDSALAPPSLNAPLHTYNFTYDPTASPMFGITARPIGVGTVSGTGSIVDLRVGFYRFSEPVDIYLALYAPALDHFNYYFVEPGGAPQPFSQSPIPWKTAVTGPIDESLFGPLSSSDLPSGTYYIYVLVTPSGALSPYYLWQTDFLN